MPTYETRAYVEIALILQDSGGEFQRKPAVGATPGNDAAHAKGRQAQASGLSNRSIYGETDDDRRERALAGLLAAEEAQASQERRRRPLPEDAEVATVAAIPVEMTVSRNTIRKADTFECTVDYLRLPVDPRALQGARITAFLWDSPDGSPPPANEENRVFMGLIDTLEVNLSSGVDKVSIKARDYTALFLDKKIPKDPATGEPKHYEINRPFRDVILEILDDVGEGVIDQIIDAFKKNYPPGKLNDKLSDSTGRNQWTTSGDLDLWSLLSRMCDVYLVLPSFYFDVLTFARATQLDSIPFNFRFGTNLKSLSYKKDFNASLKAPIEIRNYNAYADTPEERRLTGRFPLEIASTKIPDTATGSKGNKVKNVKNEAKVLQVVGNYNQKQLDDLARDYYDLARRESIQGTFETADMFDLGLNKKELARLVGTSGGFLVDMLEPRPLIQLANGDTIFLDIYRDDWESVWSLSEEAAVEYLVALGIDPGSATNILRASRAYDSKIASLYVKEAQHKWSASRGYSLKVTFTAAIGLDL